MLKVKGNKGITLIALIVTIIVLLILAGITISSLTGSESAPAKANEAKQKNDIGAARDDVYLTTQNAQMEAYQTAYVENGVSAGEASTTVGTYVRTKLNEKYGTDGNFKTGLATITATTTGNIEISTTDFVIEGEIAEKGGNLIWGEIEPNVPRISGVPETLSLDTNSNYTINAKLKGTTGDISWSSNKPSIASVSNGVITTATSMTNPTEQVLITASATGCETKTCTLTVNKIMTAKDVIPVPTSSTTSAYVKYAMNGQTEEDAELCRVLYNDNEHGLQIITASTVDNNVILGYGDNVGGAIGSTNIEKAKNSYNNAIKNLNKKAEIYIYNDDNLVLDARCVGSVSIATSGLFLNKDEDSGTFTGDYNYLTTQSINGNYKDTDTHYGTELGTDWMQMNMIEIKKTGASYWLASYEVGSDSSDTSFYVRAITSNGQMTNGHLWHQPQYGNAGVYGTPSNGLRPVFLINPTAKIKSGTGTEQDPYILEAGE